MNQKRINQAKKEQKELLSSKKSSSSSPRKAGGQPRHKSASHKHKPDKEKECNFEDSLPPHCNNYDNKTVIDQNPFIRDIVDIKVITSETRFKIQTATCNKCHTTVQAPNDLPKHGEYSKNISIWKSRLPKLDFWTCLSIQNSV